jgi:hypothetical protein
MKQSEHEIVLKSNESIGNWSIAVIVSPKFQDLDALNYSISGKSLSSSLSTSYSLTLIVCY